MKSVVLIKNTKPLIYSAVVFPGAGYFFLEKKTQGLVFLLLSIFGLTGLCYEAFFKAQIIAEKIVLGIIPPNPLLIREHILNTPGVLDPSLITGISFMLLALWLVGVLDCYRLSQSKA